MPSPPKATRSIQPSFITGSGMNRIDSYRWLASDEAAAWREAVVQERPGSTSRLDADQIRVLAEYAEVRDRLGRKFPPDQEWLFTSELLKQASSWRLARYKAERLAGAGNQRVWDLCCGAGADLAALAERFELAVGVDRDPVACLLAEANLGFRGAGNARVVCDDALRSSINATDAAHADPDRRADGRTVRSDRFQPSLGDLTHVLRRAAIAVVKLAPATPCDPLVGETEREWLGEGRETKQQLVWLGEREGPRLRRATLVGKHAVHHFESREDDVVCPITELGTRLWEPHSVIRTAGLADAYAKTHGASRISPDSFYLTASRRPPDALASSWTVIDEMGWNERRCRKRTVQLEPRVVEIKSRTGEVDCQRLSRQWSGGDGPPLVIAIYRSGKRLRAIFARREPAE